MTPMETYRKTNMTLGLASVNVLVPPSHRQDMLLYTEQARALFYEQLVAMGDPVKCAALASKRIPLVEFDKDDMAAIVKASMLVSDNEQTAACYKDLMFMSHRAKECKRELDDIDERGGSDELWTMAAARMNANAFKLKAMYDVLVMLSRGEKPTVLL